uniref:Uncharacterized protein n=1 Tax=Oryza rufipogon TaxID=4529 RepID=A0A0E0QNQ1_ORYRU
MERERVVRAEVRVCDGGWPEPGRLSHGEAAAGRCRPHILSFSLLSLLSRAGVVADFREAAGRGAGGGGAGERERDGRRDGELGGGE